MRRVHESFRGGGTISRGIKRPSLLRSYLALACKAFRNAYVALRKTRQPERNVSCMWRFQGVSLTFPKVVHVCARVMSINSCCLFAKGSLLLNTQLGYLACNFVECPRCIVKRFDIPEFTEIVATCLRTLRK